MADPSEVDAAVVAKLVADTGSGGLMTLMTDGVFIDVAPNGKTKFVIVSLAAHDDEYMFNGCAFEQSLYLVKAVDREESGLTVKAAAIRIQTLLHDVALSIQGYTHMLTRRTARLRFTEVDDIDPNIRWQHRGARYEVLVSPN